MATRNGRQPGRLDRREPECAQVESGLQHRVGRGASRVSRRRAWRHAVLARAARKVHGPTAQWYPSRNRFPLGGAGFAPMVSNTKVVSRWPRFPKVDPHVVTPRMPAFDLDVCPCQAMTGSAFAWLDYSDSERRRMLEVIDLFREKGTLDELGIGSIRDTFADRFFPAISTIQTRARYFLFVPWLYQALERERDPRRARRPTPPQAAGQAGGQPEGGWGGGGGGCDWDRCRGKHPAAAQRHLLGRHSPPRPPLPTGHDGSLSCLARPFLPRCAAGAALRGGGVARTRAASTGTRACRLHRRTCSRPRPLPCGARTPSS